MTRFSANGVTTARSGNEHLPNAPQGVYPCRGDDRWIAISVSDDAAWSALIGALGNPEWSHDPAFETSLGRWHRREAIDRGLAAATRGWDADMLMETLQASSVRAGVVRSAADIVDEDPQLRHRGHWVKLEHPEMGNSIYNAPPFRIEGAPPSPRSAAPLLGQHTDEICASVFGLPEAEIASLRAAGALS